MRIVTLKHTPSWKPQLVRVPPIHGSLPQASYRYCTPTISQYTNSKNISLSNFNDMEGPSVVSLLSLAIEPMIHL